MATELERQQAADVEALAQLEAEAAKAKKVTATYTGPGALFPGQGFIATGDTVEVWDHEAKNRTDLESAKTTKPKG